MTKIDLGNGKFIALIQGDITQQSTDAIVNAANSSLMGGGGVDGAIHRAGGPVILEECRQIRRTQYREGLPTGKAVATSAGRMQAKHVVHTVGPVWHGGNDGEADQLASAYRESLRAADELGLKSIAFPAISTGAYGYPMEEATAVAVKTVHEHLRTARRVLEVRFVVFDAHSFAVYSRELERLSRSSDDFRLDRFSQI